MSLPSSVETGLYIFRRGCIAPGDSATLSVAFPDVKSPHSTILYRPDQMKPGCPYFLAAPLNQRVEVVWNTQKDRGNFVLPQLTLAEREISLELSVSRGDVLATAYSIRN